MLILVRSTTSRAALLGRSNARSSLAQIAEPGSQPGSAIGGTEIGRGSPAGVVVSWRSPSRPRARCSPSNGVAEVTLLELVDLHEQRGRALQRRDDDGDRVVARQQRERHEARRARRAARRDQRSVQIQPKSVASEQINAGPGAAP